MAVLPLDLGTLAAFHLSWIAITLNCQRTCSSVHLFKLPGSMQPVTTNYLQGADRSTIVFTATWNGEKRFAQLPQCTPCLPWILSVITARLGLTTSAIWLADNCFRNHDVTIADNVMTSLANCRQFPDLTCRLHWDGTQSAPCLNPLPCQPVPLTWSTDLWMVLFTETR